MTMLHTQSCRNSTLCATTPTRTRKATATSAATKKRIKKAKHRLRTKYETTVPHLLFFTLLLSGHCQQLAWSFNLEQRLPIVKYGPNVKAHFGYSVATHTIGEHNWPNNTKCLLVGAPLDQNLQPGTKDSGALWKCPITQNSDDCEQIITDGRRTYDDDSLIPQSADEIKEGQWMGVTVRSQGLGGKVLVCAHRYVTIVRENRYGQGLCYVLTNNLKFDEVYEPCKGRSVVRQHEDYGFCQVGTSGALLDDNTMVLGTPGPFTWRGTIFVTEIGGEYLERDKNMYYSDHSDATSPVDKYSYLGMAVTGGRYFGERMSYAAGAPRSNGHGQVVIFDKANTSPIPVRLIIDGEQFASSFGYELTTADINGDQKPDLIAAAPFYFSKNEGGAVYVYQNDKDMLPQKPTLKLTGTLESRFGLALANIGDLNKDNCEDIAVGAPYEGDGVVYIYLGSRTGLNSKPSQRIPASDLGGLLPKPIRTFGISIAGNTDLDGNSYPDLVVGAYNSSAVVALLARPIISIQTTYSGSELRNIDPNKQRCIGNASTNLTCFTFEVCCSIDPYEQSGTSKELNLLATVEAETYEHQKKFSRVFFDHDDKRSNVIKSEVRVGTNGRSHCQQIIGYIKDNTRDIQTPIKMRLSYTLVEPPLADSGLIRLNPMLDQTQAHIEFEGTFQKDCGDDDECESNLLLEAQLDAYKADENYALTLGEKEEVRVNVNVSNLADSAYETQLFIVHPKSISYIAALKKNNAICNRFNDTVVSCGLGNPMRRGSTTDVSIRFDPSSLELGETKLQFHIFANTTSKLVGSDRPERTLDVRVVKHTELTLRGWAIPEQSFYSGAVKLDNSPMKLEDVGSSLTHTFWIYNEGPWRAPKVLLTIDWPYQVYSERESGKTDQHLLYLVDVPTIENVQGECKVSPEYVNPLKLQPAYLSAPASMMMHPSKLQRNESYPHFVSTYHRIRHKTEALNPFKHGGGMATEAEDMEPSAPHNRVRRDTFIRIVRPERFMDGRDANGKTKKRHIVELNCNKAVNCIKIQCEIYDMPAKTETQVHVKARLWNSTLVSLYPRVDLVRIFSKAHVEIPNDLGVKQSDNNNNHIMVETRAYPELLDQQRDTSTPLWLCILAGVLGLVLLGIFTCLLWKCGFFKRKRPMDPTLSGNLEKMNEGKPFLDEKVF
ncbi:integrin alpha-PS1 isoform X2 [Scaptodrosophila lebanonensis]|uniref:Integrin alpha-PS1 isoform X2 n=1 Tax=Drosophila lebanonensis TaxID=7225 RepID=A0A6J2TTY7_DROLE|nr:integrin alpha-PS1 isoform X2 [Scaptodrosophila lebanonensis]